MTEHERSYVLQPNAIFQPIDRQYDPVSKLIKTNSPAELTVDSARNALKDLIQIDYAAGDLRAYKITLLPTGRFLR